MNHEKDATKGRKLYSLGDRTKNPS
jgi:hypothetical protein